MYALLLKKALQIKEHLNLVYGLMNRNRSNKICHKHHRKLLQEQHFQGQALSLLLIATMFPSMARRQALSSQRTRQESLLARQAQGGYGVPLLQRREQQDLMYTTML